MRPSLTKRLVATSALFALVGALVYSGVALSASPEVGLPQRIAATTPCPVAGCVQPDGACHAAAPAPEPDGSLTMQCPQVAGCTDVACHAWERIEAGALRGKPSDASMNLWILAPVVLVVGLVALVRKL